MFSSFSNLLLIPFTETLILVFPYFSLSEVVLVLFQKLCHFFLRFMHPGVLLRYVFIILTIVLKSIFY